jgi:hypothetical protein
MLGKTDFTVSREPMMVKDQNTNEMKVSPKEALYRTDTGQYLAYGVSKNYGIVQNSDVIRMIESAIPDAKITESRAIRNGSISSFLILLDDEYVIPSRCNDIITRHLCVVNTFGNGNSIMIGARNTVLSCNNQMYRFTKTAFSKTRHTKQVEDVLEQKIIEIGVAITAEKQLMEQFKELTTVKVDDAHVFDLVNQITDIDLTKVNNYTTKQVAKAQRLHSCILQEMEQKGKTGWGLFNGVTYWTNHARTHKTERDNDLMRGTGYSINQQALKFSLELV